MSLEGSVLYKNEGLTAIKDGKPDPQAFRGVLDESLDTLKLAEVYDPYTRSYKRSDKAVPTDVTCREIREHLYTHDFDIDGIHYVRYKRSAGASRDGRCLFIAEPLYADMMALPIPHESKRAFLGKKEALFPQNTLWYRSNSASLVEVTG